MANSRIILEKMVANLAQYVQDTTVKYDLYRSAPNELENSTLAVRCRMALYSDADTVQEKVAAYKAGLTQTRYSIDITVWRGYKNEPATNAELVLADYFDKVIDWTAQVQPSIVTQNRLLYFGYDGATDVTRLTRTVTQTLRFIGLRDFTQTQS